MNQRTIFQFKENKILHLKTKQGKEIRLSCSDTQHKQLEEIEELLHHGNVFQLLNTEWIEDNLIVCEFLIYEPDYLIDISSMAECYRPFGHHPLNYTLSRFYSQENTRYILLGNAANLFIDELVNEKESTIDYRKTLQKLFKAFPFEFTACSDLKEPKIEKDFFKQCETQFNNIRKIIAEQFPKENIDREKIIVEPSFICNLLGLQGRLDLMMQNFSAFVELKSGKAEEFYPSGMFKHSSINHYTQITLYLAILEFNLNLSSKDVSSYLLYSKYPILSKEQHSRQHLENVLFLRNKIVAQEYNIQYRNNIDYTNSVLKKITADNLNTANLHGRFFENYLRPQINEIHQMIASLDKTERSFFARIYTFIVKEMWCSKVGEREYEGVKRSSNLWNAPIKEKIASGELLYDLQITENQAAGEKHYIRFSIPSYDDNYLPNFRHGDAIVLYEYPKGAEKNCSLKKKQVFKGNIETITTNSTTIRLRARQRNTTTLPAASNYAIEHDYMDSIFTGMFKGLAAFSRANQDRRDLLLGRRMPQFKTTININNADDISRIVDKALSAEDCFLLVGPPGTGKTSQALKEIVVRHLNSNCKKSNILLLSYTNRAVDEICKAVSDIGEQIPFIRIGNDLNCEEKYRSRLLDNILGLCNNRSEVHDIIDKTSIFVGTVASVWNKPDIFKLKYFDMAIIDEATQLLEPHLLGLLSAKTPNGSNAIKRFVLIGDHKQLPAVILQSKEESEVKEANLHAINLRNLNESLFERLYRIYRENNQEMAFDMLCKQGRMHPEIAAFPSLHFYENKLSLVGLPHQQINSTLHSPIQERIVFIPSVRSDEDKSDKVNLNEARIISLFIRDLCNYYNTNKLPVDIQSIGIITPYRSQIALIRNTIEELSLNILPDITIDTVERFQGSQKDIILYSFCLNADWQLESLPHWLEENGKLIDRKLNVALTRARKQLIITGNPKYLSRIDLYDNLIQKPNVQPTE